MDTRTKARLAKFRRRAHNARLLDDLKAKRYPGITARPNVLYRTRWGASCRFGKCRVFQRQQLTLIVQPHPRTITCTHLHPWRTGLLGTVPIVITQPMGAHHPHMYLLHHPPMYKKSPRKYSYIARHIDFAKAIDSPSPRRPQNHEWVFLSVPWDLMPDCWDLPLALTKRHRL
jgi:hypothetical protein